MRIIGLDVGEKRIGVARADSNTRIAIPVGFIEVDGSEWQKIAKIATLNNTLLFVLGLPRSNEGNETAQTLYVRNFAKILLEKIPGAKIRFQDESFTSVEAEERLKIRSKILQKGDIDAEAAAIILQDFLETFKAEEKTLEDSAKFLKKEADKIKLNSKKAGHQMKKVTKWLTGVSIFVILGLLATGGALWIKDYRARERAAEYARLEAEMEAEVFNFTIRPGETIYDIKRNLAEIGYSTEDIEAGFAADYDFEFLRERPAGATLEGYLYGDTHEFYQTATVQEILKVFLTEMGKVITENDLENKYAARGLSLFEGITLASVVQKEANSDEHPTVAQVFLSRLALGIPMGSDVTVSYALDTIDPDRHTYTDNQAALAVNSCYNTRLFGGLPCGPISNPSLSALLAVAEPSNTSYLYFLTGDDGLMYYSYTEAEHLQNSYLHCKELCNISL